MYTCMYIYSSVIIKTKTLPRKSYLSSQPITYIPYLYILVYLYLPTFITSLSEIKNLLDILVKKFNVIFAHLFPSMHTLSSALGKKETMLNYMTSVYKMTCKLACITTEILEAGV